MANGGGFSFDLTGLNAITSRLDQLEHDIDRRLDEKLTKIANKIIHDAKLLAPVGVDAGGDLEASLIVDEVKHLIGLAYIDFGTSPEVDAYAVVQHEGFRMNAKGKITMNPGEVTRSKPSYEGFAPGKKFLENAIKLNAKYIKDELSGLLEGW